MADPTDNPDFHIEGTLYCCRCAEYRAEIRRCRGEVFLLFFAIAGIALGAAAVLLSGCF